MKNNLSVPLKTFAAAPQVSRCTRRTETRILVAACCALMSAAAGLPARALETAPNAGTPNTAASKAVEALPEAAPAAENAAPLVTPQETAPPAVASASTRDEESAPPAAVAAVPSQRPNVLVIPLDDLIFDALPAARTSPATTPLPPAVSPIAPGATPSITLIPAVFSFDGAGFSSALWSAQNDARVLVPRYIQAPDLSFPSGGLPQALPDSATEIAPPGPAQLAASALRRAFLKRNWNDVLTASPDSAVFRRAINEKRIAPTEMQALRTAMAQLIMSDGAAAASTREGAVPLAARLGQALGYRAVILLAVAPPDASSYGSASGALKSANYVMLAVDAVRENGEVLRFSQSGATTVRLNEAAATTALSTLETSLQKFGEVSRGERTDRLRDYVSAGRAALRSGNAEEAKNLAARALSLSVSNGDANVLMGDALRATEPAAAVSFYKRVLGSRALEGGEVWERIASAYATAKNWPETLEAGRRALGLGHDTASLRMALATAQFGRAAIFRDAGRSDSADAAIADARAHLDKARVLAPGDAEVARLLATNLIAQKMYREALQTLDVFVPKFPDDTELQSLYAQALTEIGGRNTEAFRAWSRAWSLNGTSSAPITQSQYRKLGGAFDEYAAALTKRAAQLAMAVASDTLPRDSSLLQLVRIGNEMNAASAALKVMNPERSSEAHATRIFAAELLVQAVENYRAYVENGESESLQRAAAIHRQAILQLNAVRNAG